MKGIVFKPLVCHVFKLESHQGLEIVSCEEVVQISIGGAPQVAVQLQMDT
jgi:hypothetical protein